MRGLSHLHIGRAEREEDFAMHADRIYCDSIDWPPMTKVIREKNNTNKNEHESLGVHFTLSRSVDVTHFVWLKLAKISRRNHVS
jgi:hypothetical protein